MAKTGRSKDDGQIADFLSECRFDPLKYVMGAFPWEEDSSIQIVPLSPKYQERFPGCKWGPDEWQCEFLDEWGEEMRERGFDGHMPVDPLRFSTVSGHGIGKSTLSAWIVKFILDTRPHSVGTVSANTAPQLRTKTWSEVGKWHALSITEHWFTYTNSSNTMSLIYNDKMVGLTWKCNAQTCDPKNSEAFAGQHASNSTSFYLFDEASKIADKLFEVREGGLAAGEPMAFDFGNGTRNSGRFFENCAGRYKDQYIVRSIDSRKAYRVNKNKVEEDRKIYGEDSDYFRTRWKGLFPSKGATQFIGGNSVRDAQLRKVISDHKNDPLVLGVDVGRFGDDESVIYPRIGYDCRSFEPRRFKGFDSSQVAFEVAQYISEFKQIGKRVSAINVDGGGGYGGGVVDKLRDMGLSVSEVSPGAAAINKRTYALRIDEMWGNLRESLPYLALPGKDTKDGEELYDQLTQREYGHTLREQIRLEPKASLKERLGCSPDLADALALTFAKEVFGEADMGGSSAGYVELEEVDEDLD